MFGGVSSMMMAPTVASGPPVWVPAGATTFADFTTVDHYYGGGATHIPSDFLGGAYVPANLTASGLGIFAANSNRPSAAGALFTALAACNNTVVFEWQWVASGVSATCSLMNSIFTGTSSWVDCFMTAPTSGGDCIWSTAEGEYPTVGNPNQSGTNKLAGTYSGGVLASLNGLTSVMSNDLTPIPPITTVEIGNIDGIAPLEGYMRKITVYPTLMTGAQLQALST